MKTRYQLYILVALLLILGLSAALYKHFSLGFTFTPGGQKTVWQVQAKIQFEADGGPVKISMTLPSPDDSRRGVFSENLAEDYKYQLIEKDGIKKAVWSKQSAKGLQTLYLRGDAYFLGESTLMPPAEPLEVFTFTDETREAAAKAIMQKARASADTDHQLVQNILQIMDPESKDGNVKLLFEDLQFRSEQMQQAAKVIGLANIKSFVIRGLRLQEDYTQRSISTFIQIYLDEKWVLMDPKSLTEIPAQEVVLWPVNTRGLLDVFGGINSSIYLSVSSSKMNSGQLAVIAGQQSKNPLIDFSIYSLPIKDQTTFKLLLLMPLGALVVVILRNLVGIRTSGTFMPILIALTFMQTTLLLGLLLFLVVVSVGLIMRSYLSHLNLLLVPRIASVLVFVIIIFAFIGITSHKMGWESGLTITMFPMIILSWTIERMSILWEEEGPREVLVQGGGSLITATLAYLVMINPYLEHLTFNFPELLLVLLAVIISIGSYSGYRLVELARFEPMTRD